MKKPKQPKPPKHRMYRVWFDQINQDVLEVKATCLEEARDKALRRWRKLNLPPRMTDMQPLPHQ